jgi:hypothetical protein
MVVKGVWNTKSRKVTKARSTKVHEAGRLIASWSSRFASFAPLHVFVFQTPRSNQFQVHPHDILSALDAGDLTTVDGSR